MKKCRGEGRREEGQEIGKWEIGRGRAEVGVDKKGEYGVRGWKR